MTQHYIGHRGKYINVTGLIDEDNPDSFTVKRLTPTPEKEAVAVDIVNNFFIGRKVELAEGTNTLQAIATDKAGNDATYPETGSHTVALEEDVDEDYEYDLRGNMIVKKVDDEAVARYFYNKDNFIEYIWYPEDVHDDEHPHYIYDGLNRRVKVEYGTVTLDQDDDFSSFGDVDKTKEYVFSGTVPIIEYDNDGQSRTVAKQYYWGTGLPGGIGGLLYMKVPGSPDAYYYYHYDGGGNVTCITDADKDIMALYEYDAFGNIITKCGSLANDFLFSTQLANTNAGWHMYMYRNYDPMLGRWTQRDPIKQNFTANLYDFCYNNPINFADLLGLRPYIPADAYRIDMDDFVSPDYKCPIESQPFCPRGRKDYCREVKLWGTCASCEVIVGGGAQIAGGSTLIKAGGTACVIGGTSMVIVGVVLIGGGVYIIGKIWDWW